MKKLIDFIFLVREIRSRQGDLHFKRWSPFTKWLAPFFDKYLFNVYIHLINKADEDIDMHDHPWNFVSIIIRGGYREQTPNGVKHRRELTISYKKAEELHRVKKLDMPTHTLVFTSKRLREWGFQTKDGWLTNEEYRKRKHNS